MQRGPEVSDLRTVVRGHFAVWPENLDLTSAESGQRGGSALLPNRLLLHAVIRSSSSERSSGGVTVALPLEDM